MTAETIAKVVRDVIRGNVVETDLAIDQLNGLMVDAEVVDVTAIYNGWNQQGTIWNLYDDSVLRPPLMNAVYGWVNQHGNGVVCPSVSIAKDYHRWDELAWQPKSPAEHVIDWDEVEWVTIMALYCGGFSKTTQRHVPTHGPLGTVKMAIDRDGKLIDAGWAISGLFGSTFVQANLEYDLAVYTQAVTMMNCRNVEILPPTTRPRAEQRRIDRTGIRVSEIHVWPAGQWRRKTGGRNPERLGSDTPYGTVRGHVAKYGPAYNRGLLFGKYEGEFWIPQHVRGSREAGEVKHTYEVEA